MPPTKSHSKLPKGWPGNTTYLSAPSFSKKLDAEKIKTLVSSKTDLLPGAQILKTSSPSTNVKITPISDSTHPACGQNGLFANEHLLPNAFILPYLGYVHDHTDTDETSDYDLSLDRELGISVDATRMGNEARFINDFRGVSAAPNAEFRDIHVDAGNGKVEKRVGVFVLSAGKSGKRAKGISRGQEILVSYGKGFWTERQPAEV
ncbi:Nn.00g111630.m01.CDS01 [Neocucurbitaria sp. VM-36]